MDFPIKHKECVIMKNQLIDQPFKLFQGFSLLELLVILAIIAILASIAPASFSHLIKHTQSDLIQDRVSRAINNTRISAITKNTIVVLCPYGITGCENNWINGAMIMTDKNNNRELDPEDVLLEKIDFPANKTMEITWRASGGRNFLRFSPTGITREFGRFIICSKQKQPDLARGIVINRQGRVRFYKDYNKDGIVEDKDGSKVNC